MRRYYIILWMLFASIGFTQGQSRLHFKAIRLNDAQPVIYEQMFTDLGATEDESYNMNGPSVIRVPDWIAPENRTNPDAKYYCYFAHHDGEYIRMAWAADIEGPWHLYDVGSGVEIGDRGVLDHGGESIHVGGGYVIDPNHLASPNVHVDEENQRIILYFHSGSSTWYNGEEINSQISWVSTSPYGLEFYDNIDSVFLGSSYFSVFEYGGEIYALDNGASIYRALDPSAPWTPPADHNYKKGLWEKLGNNPFQQNIEDNTGLSSAELRVRHTGTKVVGDELYVFYSQRGDLLEHIQMSSIDLTVDWTQWDPTWPPVTILESSYGWEGGELTPMPSESGPAPENVNQMRDPYLFEDSDGSLYLFYTGRGEDAIGIASILTDSVAFAMPPAKPYLLKAVAISGSEISLSWTDNAENEGGYIVERKQGEGEYISIATLGLNSTSYGDTELSSSTSYTYRIAAFNDEGNSNYSELASANTFPEGTAFYSHFVTEDTYIRGGIYADENFGSDVDLMVKKGNSPDFFRNTLVKFDLSSTEYISGAVENATLKLYANRSEASRATAYEIDDNWTEAATTWATAPLKGVAISSTALSSVGVIYEWDVTDYVKAQLSGDKIVSILLDDPDAVGANIEFNSKETGTNIPELVLRIDSDYSTTSKAQSGEALTTIYPNPGTGIFTIYHPQGDEYGYEIYSMDGKLVSYRVNAVGYTATFDLTGFDPGIYIVVVRSARGVANHKIILQ